MATWERRQIPRAEAPGRFRGASRALAPGDAFRSQGQVFAATALGNAQGTYRVPREREGVAFVLWGHLFCFGSTRKERSQTFWDTFLARESNVGDVQSASDFSWACVEMWRFQRWLALKAWLVDVAWGLGNWELIC